MNSTWLCFNAMDELPENFTSIYEVPDYSPALPEKRPYNARIVGKGGCYRDGNYSVGNSGHEMSLDTTKMVEAQIYVILLLLQKDKRYSIAYQVLDLVQGDPPTLGIK